MDKNVEHQLHELWAVMDSMREEIDRLHKRIDYLEEDSITHKQWDEAWDHLGDILS